MVLELSKRVSKQALGDCATFELNHGMSFVIERTFALREQSQTQIVPYFWSVLVSRAAAVTGTVEQTLRVLLAKNRENRSRARVFNIWDSMEAAESFLPFNKRFTSHCHDEGHANTVGSARRELSTQNFCLDLSITLSEFRDFSRCYSKLCKAFTGFDLCSHITL